VEYDAIAFRQMEGSPLQVAFVTPTSELDTWARVPTRLASQPHGFQRAEIKRHVEEIQQFFKADATNQNSSPTSILLGLDPDLKDHVRLLTADGEPLDPASISTNPVRCQVAIDFDPWDPSRFDGDLDAEIAALMENVLPWLESRSSSALREVEPAERGATEVAEDVAFEAEEIEDLADGEEETEEEEQERADELAEESEDGPASPLETPITGEAPTLEELQEIQFLADLDLGKLRALQEDASYRDWPNDQAGQDQRQWLIRALKDELKPGLIIDGQHRVRGTKDLQDVPFLISLLPDANWPELAFQFIVNNGSAKKVSNNLLMAIVGQSLMPDQLQSIEVRLLKAGIKVALIRASMRLQLEDNPFMGMLTTGTPGEVGFLDATAMQRKVVEIWFGRRDKSGLNPRLLGLRHPYDREAKSFRILDMFGANCPKGTRSERAEYWQNGDDQVQGLWFDYFSALWDALEEKYSPRLWPATSDDWPSPKRGASSEDQERLKLMRATMLGLVQHCVLYKWARNREVYLRHQKKRMRTTPILPEDFKQEIADILKPLTEDFFLEHRATGLDASDHLRDEFRRQCYAVLEGDKTVAQVKKSSPQWST
jgi:hypothetical protein